MNKLDKTQTKRSAWKQKERQLSGTNRIKSRIPPFKQKGKEAHTQIGKLLRKHAQ